MSQKSDLWNEQQDPDGDIRRSAPAECVHCKRTTGPMLEIDAECPGWMCDECYSFFHNRCPSCGGSGWIEITKAPFCEHGNRERECCPDCDGEGHL